jgi:hypothetical protein
VEILPPETRELLDLMGELQRTGKVEKDEQIFDTLDE